jgi:hypothetical protein
MFSVRPLVPFWGAITGLKAMLIGLLAVLFLVCLGVAQAICGTTWTVAFTPDQSGVAA